MGERDVFEHWRAGGKKMMSTDTTMNSCPQCEAHVDDGELHCNEGVCETCCEQNQSELDEHNWRHDWWSRLSDDERGAIIRNNN